MLRVLLFTCLFALMSWEGLAQTASVIGVIVNEEDTPLEFVNLAIKGTTQGTTTDKNGDFELEIPANQRVVVLISFVGYQKDSLVLQLKPGEQKREVIRLEETMTELSTIEVKDEQLRTSTFSRINPKAINIMPTINASVEDIIKTMPGVSSRDELSSQYSVRGGNYDENLVFVNE